MYFPADLSYQRQFFRFEGDAHYSLFYNFTIGGGWKLRFEAEQKAEQDSKLAKEKLAEDKSTEDCSTSGEECLAKPSEDL